MQFSEIIALPLHGRSATRLHGVLATFADREIARVFGVFNFSVIPDDVALPSEDMLHTTICTYNCNAIIS